MMNTEWVTVKEFEGKEDVVARVQRRGDFRPQYSIQLGRRRRDEPERLTVFIPARTDGGKVDRTAENLVRQALDYVEEDFTQHDDIREAREREQATDISSMAAAENGRSGRARPVRNDRKRNGHD